MFDNIFNNDAVKRIYEIKQRDASKPLSVLVQNVESLELIADLNKGSRAIVNKWLPGPFTFILNKKKIVSPYVSASAKVGVRIPDYKIATSLASLFPITTTSANLTNEDTLSNPQDILRQISGEDFETVARNIIVFEPTSFKEQEEDLGLIESWISSNSADVELIILDSAVALFRVEDDNSKSHLLGKQMQMLSALAINHDLAVLVTNQIYASFDEESEEDFSPVGGTIIQYRSKIIIELKREEGTNQRIAILKRHKTKREGLAVHFLITNNGIE